jgi:hypothetical protein
LSSCIASYHKKKHNANSGRSEQHFEFENNQTVVAKSIGCRLTQKTFRDKRVGFACHPGYAISQEKRKRTEEPFGWAKTIGGLARPMLRGVARMRFKFTLTMARLRPDPITQVARLDRMTTRRLSEMKSISAKLAINALANVLL